jgi:(2Fe-2S) ferredoxin
VRLAAFQPQLQLFVCANERADDAPLGPGCGARGREVFAELKREAMRRGLATRVWVTETKCLGVCPREGCALAISSGGGVFEGVTAADARTLMSRLEGSGPR